MWVESRVETRAGLGVKEAFIAQDGRSDCSAAESWGWRGRGLSSEVVSTCHPLTLDLYKVTCIGVLVKKVQSKDLVAESQKALSPKRCRHQLYILDLYVQSIGLPDFRATHETGWAYRRDCQSVLVQDVWPLDGDSVRHPQEWSSGLGRQRLIDAAFISS